METSTRERLTGALLVVLAVVIVAPELLSGRRAGHSGPAPAQDPEAGAPLQTFDGPIDATAEMPATRSVPAEAAAAIAAVPPPVAPAAALPLPDNAADPSPMAVAAAKEGTAAPATTEARERDRRPTTVQSTEKQKPSAMQPAKEAIAGATTAKWWVQVGSFASTDNAQRVAKRLRAAGFAIDVSHGGIKGKELYRVRAGPVADKATANALRARLVAAGEKNAAVVTP